MNSGLTPVFSSWASNALSVECLSDFYETLPFSDLCEDTAYHLGLIRLYLQLEPFPAAISNFNLLVAIGCIATTLRITS